MFLLNIQEKFDIFNYNQCAVNLLGGGTWQICKAHSSNLEKSANRPSNKLKHWTERFQRSKELVGGALDLLATAGGPHAWCLLLRGVAWRRHNEHAGLGCDRRDRERALWPSPVSEEFYPLRRAAKSPPHNARAGLVSEQSTKKPLPRTVKITANMQLIRWLDHVSEHDPIHEVTDYLK